MDFGCGSGSTISQLNKFGKVFGVDIEQQAIKYCQSKGIENVKLIKPDRLLPFKYESFDVITCMDVLEHITDESETLKKLHRVLKKKGLLIVTVPAFAFLWGELDKRSHHIRRYGKNELIRILENSGFIVKKITYFNYLFFIPIVLIRIFQKSFLGTRFFWGVDPVVKNDWVNEILTSIFYFDVVTALNINPPFGVSLLALATKAR